MNEGPSRSPGAGPRRAVAGVVALALALGIAGACSGDDRPEAETADGVQAVVKTFAFQPDPVQVERGSGVTWTNEDDIGHTVTSGTRQYEPGDTGKVVGEQRDGMFDITLDGKGQKATMRFPNPGKFHYFCARHPGMEGDVVVT